MYIICIFIGFILHFNDYQKEQLIQNEIQPENIRIEIRSTTNEIKNRIKIIISINLITVRCSLKRLSKRK